MTILARKIVQILVLRAATVLATVDPLLVLLIDKKNINSPNQLLIPCLHNTLASKRKSVRHNLTDIIVIKYLSQLFSSKDQATK